MTAVFVSEAGDTSHCGRYAHHSTANERSVKRGKDKQRDGEKERQIQRKRD